jgi:hypothetical protein
MRATAASITHLIPLADDFGLKIQEGQRTGLEIGEGEKK